MSFTERNHKQFARFKWNKHSFYNSKHIIYTEAAAINIAFACSPIIKIVLKWYKANIIE